jgi:hypothetical protein
MKPDTSSGIMLRLRYETRYIIRNHAANVQVLSLKST